VKRPGLRRAAFLLCKALDRSGARIAHGVTCPASRSPLSVATRLGRCRCGLDRVSRAIKRLHMAMVHA